ncbi:MAG: hypothetical protein NW224_03310 [Leptolyngbyaceae cyanobacterium bins.302]|nr:hypothetical protein [Leptolyngbyaceae cyanobacterium bins.302]
MTVFTRVKQIFSIFLVVVAVMFGSFFASPVLATPKAPEIANNILDGGGNSVDAYRGLQKATYAYRNQGGVGEGSQTGRLGNRRELAERTGAKLQNRMNKRRDLTSQPNSVEDAAQNMVDNTQGAFQRTAGKIQRNLNLDR